MRVCQSRACGITENKLQYTHIMTYRYWDICNQVFQCLHAHIERHWLPLKVRWLSIQRDSRKHDRRPTGVMTPGHHWLKKRNYILFYFCDKGSPSQRKIFVMRPLSRKKFQAIFFVSPSPLYLHRWIADMKAINRHLILSLWIEMVNLELKPPLKCLNQPGLSKMARTHVPPAIEAYFTAQNHSAEI